MLAIILPAGSFAQAQTAPAMPNLDDTIELQVKDEPMAVFIYNRYLWIVADNTIRLNIDNLRKKNSNFLGVPKKINTRADNVFIIPLSAPNLSLQLRKPQNDTLQIIVQRPVARPSEIIAPVFEMDAKKMLSLAMNTKNNRQMLTIPDPFTGNDLSVVLFSNIGNGVYPARTFSQFNLLQTAQGIVIQKLSDDIKIGINDKSLLKISADNGLKVSADEKEHTDFINQQASSEDEAGRVLFSYNKLKIGDEANFVTTQIKLFQGISEGYTQAANQDRLRLLHIYFSEGLFAESLGMSNDILRSSYRFFHDNKVIAFRGVAHYFMRHYTEAENDFEAAELAGLPEFAMWRNVCADAKDPGSDHFDFLKNYEPYISKYPPVFIQKLALLAADNAINHKHYDDARSIFDILTKNNLAEPVHNYVEYMEAKILSETKNEEEAARIWEKQAGYVDDPLIRASAEFSLVNMLIKQDRITNERAIKRLEKLRMVWRGDGLEFNILTLIGNLYLENKRYEKALRAFKEVVTYFPQYPETVNVAERMENTFINLYNKGAANSLPPLDALALFYEFRDLVPAGKDGDMMIRNLADRLASIDLLDRAALLLDHQVQKRLEGYERSRVGAKLALLYLENHQPDNALDTLKTTGYGELSPEIQLTRLRLTAEALAEQGRTDKSIEVLSSDNSQEGTRIRLEIYWKNKDWTNVISASEDILANRTDPGAALTADESEVLLKLATAYVYEHDAGQIQYLRDYFTPLLKDNPNKDSFLFITSESGIIDYENLANLDADINTVKNFIDNSKGSEKKN